MRRATWETTAVQDLVELAVTDRRQARLILNGILRYLGDGHGDVRKLEGRDNEWWLRIGDWRVTFARGERDSVAILTIRNRRDAYKD